VIIGPAFSFLADALNTSPAQIMRLLQEGPRIEAIPPAFKDRSDRWIRSRDKTKKTKSCLKSV
jgi:hypothetical protein